MPDPMPLADTLHRSGLDHAKANRWREAAECYRQALALRPDFPEALNNLGNAHRQLNQLAEAAKSYQKALALRPNYPRALSNFAVTLVLLQRFDDAIACCRQAVKLQPDMGEAWNNLGLALVERGDLDEAIAVLQRAIAILPKYVDGYYNLGRAFRFSNRIAEAIPAYRRALELQPGHVQAGYNLAICLLLTGQWTEGWPMYDLRFKMVPQSPWMNGAIPGGQTAKSPGIAPLIQGLGPVHIRCEQGLGDTIQFVRFLTLLQRPVILSCPSRLKPLLSTLRKADLTLASDGDADIPLLSLPRHFNITLDNLAADAPYLFADAERVDRWKARLGPGRKIGIAWQGNPGYQLDQHRSIRLDHFAPLSQLPGVELISLQMGPGVEQLQKAAFPVRDFGQELDAEAAFVDSAAILMQLDLFVTSDSALAHLAGALGVPTWLLVPFAPDWRWMLEREDSPWYPTLRLFRQKRPGDWADVFERIRTAWELTPTPGAEAVAEFQAAEIHRKKGNLAAAIESYQLASLRAPDWPQPRLNRGCALYQRGRAAEGLRELRRALVLAPTWPAVHFNLGLIAKHLELTDLARYHYERAIALKPDYGEALTNFSLLEQGLGRHDRALELGRRAVKALPSIPESHNNLGSAYLARDDWQNARDCYLAAIRLRPDSHVFWSNAALAHTHLRELPKAENCYRQSLARNAAHPESHWNLAWTLLLQGRLEEGWKHFAFWRQCPQFTSQTRRFPQPMWNGEPLTGKSLLVFAEQALGDTIQFVRYLPMVKAGAAKIVFECQAILEPLLKNVAGVDRLVVRGQPVPACDFQVALLDLPRLMGTTLANVPAPIPYLHADPVRIEKWRQRLADVPGRKIGIAWQGSKRYPEDRWRSPGLAPFEALAQVPGVRLIGLQKGPGTDEIAKVGFEVIDWSAEMDDDGAFLDTAALMTQLDLVVTSDTAIPHLSGALGVPTWIALPWLPDWRWLLDRDDSPWYPGVRLFRQPVRGDWAAVFRDIRLALAK